MDFNVKQFYVQQYNNNNDDDHNHKDLKYSTTSHMS